MTDLDQGDASVPTHRPNRSRPYAGDVSDAGVAYTAMRVGRMIQISKRETPTRAMQTRPRAARAPPPIIPTTPAPTRQDVSDAGVAHRVMGVASSLEDLV